MGKFLAKDDNRIALQQFAPSTIATVATDTGVAVANYIAFCPTKACSYAINSDTTHTATLASGDIRFLSGSIATVTFNLAMAVEFM
jgi:hypothetical protein